MMRRDEAERLVADIACGDRSETAPEWQEAVRAFPDLVSELATLRAMQRELDWSTADAAALAAAAAAEVTPRDRDQLRRALPPPSRRAARWRWPMLLAALLGVSVLVLSLLQPPPKPDGMLGDETRRVRVERAAGRIVLHPEGDLAQGRFYRATLYVAERRVDDEEFPAAPITLPPQWTETIEAATTAIVTLEVEGFAAVRVRVK